MVLFVYGWFLARVPWKQVDFIYKLKSPVFSFSSPEKRKKSPETPHVPRRPRRGPWPRRRPRLPQLLLPPLRLPLPQLLASYPASQHPAVWLPMARRLQARRLTSLGGEDCILGRNPKPPKIPIWVGEFKDFCIFHPENWGNDPIWRACLAYWWLNHQLDKALIRPYEGDDGGPHNPSIRPAISCGVCDGIAGHL